MEKVGNIPDKPCYLAMEISQLSVESASWFLLTVDNKMQQDIDKFKEGKLKEGL